MFNKAVKKKAKLRLGIVGSAGSGKSYSSLLIAKGLGGKIAVIDTENGSANLYADLCEYDVCTIKAPYTMQKYLEAIKSAEKLGYNTIIIDSLSHAWAGEGGLLEQVDKISQSSQARNSYTAWRSVTPQHNHLIDAMLTSSCHIIATMRTKTDYVMQENEKGKQMPVKVGLAPIQREGMDYEFTVVFDIDAKHNAITSKDRTSLFDNLIFTPSEETGEMLLQWLESGEEEPLITSEQIAEMEDLAIDKIKLAQFYRVESINKLTKEQAQEAIDKKIEKLIKEKEAEINNRTTFEGAMDEPINN